MLRTGLLAALCVSTVDGFNLGSHTPTFSRRAGNLCAVCVVFCMHFFDGLMLDALKTAIGTDHLSVHFIKS